MLWLEWLPLSCGAVVEEREGDKDSGVMFAVGKVGEAREVAERDDDNEVREGEGAVDGCWALVVV